MPATNEEILLIRNRLIAKFGDETLKLASMATFFYANTAHLGHFRDANMVPLTKCVQSRLEELGLSFPAFVECVKELDQVNATLALLADLPD